MKERISFPILHLLAVLLILTAAVPASADTLGNVLRVDESNGSFNFQCENGVVSVALVKPGIVSVRIAPEGEELPVIKVSAGGQKANLVDGDRAYRIEFAGGTVEIGKEPFGFRIIYNKGASTLDLLPVNGIEFQGQHYIIRFSLNEKERFYGVGEPDQRECKLPLQLNNRSYPIWNKHFPPSRLIIPFLFSSNGYGLFFDNTYKAELDVGEKFSDVISYEADGGPIAFYVMLDPNPLGILEKYTSLTGRQPLPPLWSLGLIQSKFGYRNRWEVEELASTFRQKKIPCDAIVLDIFWFTNMGDLSFNQDLWPKPEEMINKLKDKGIRIILIEEPYVITASPNFKVVSDKGFGATNPASETYVVQMWRGPAALFDYSQPEARKWWADQHKDLIEMGIGGWWTDLNEPEVDHHDLAFQGGDIYSMHNAQALLMQSAVFDAVKRYAPDRRPLILSRSAFAGSQKYGTCIWSGDVQSSWEALARQSVLAQSSSLAGLAFWNSDIGGFHGDPSPELYIRWLQFGLFAPMTRPHGDHSVREPWQFGGEVEAIARKNIDVRYSLLPYIYTAFYRTYQRGEPLIQPLFIYFPDDERVYGMGNQYMFGESLLVAPVTKDGAREWPVYLPAGKWYDFHTGKVCQGGEEITAASPLDYIPVFARAGAIVPRLEPMQYTMEKPWDKILLDVYAGADGNFELYEDDFLTNDYQKGRYAITPISYSEGDGTAEVVIDATRPGAGGDPRTFTTRSYILRLIGGEKPNAVSHDGSTLSENTSGGTGWHYDAESKRLEVTLPDILLNKKTVVKIKYQ